MRRFFMALSAQLGMFIVAGPLLGGCTALDLSSVLETNGADTVDGATNVAVNHAPVAAAGADLGVLSGELVVLDGASTADEDADRLQFIWGQVLGSPKVTLVDGFSSAPRFFAPTVTSTTVLTFRLTVGDGQAISSDEVSVTVWP